MKRTMRTNVFLTAIAALFMAGHAHAAISGVIASQIDCTIDLTVAAGDPAYSQYVNFDDRADWVVSNAVGTVDGGRGTFGVFAEKPDAGIFDSGYSATGAVATTAGVQGSHNGLGNEPITYVTVTGSFVDRPSLSWTWGAGSTVGVKLVNLPEDGTLQWYYNHGDNGHSHDWTATRYDSGGVAQEDDAWNVTTGDFAILQVDVDWTGAQADDYIIVESTGQNPTFHAMAVVAEAVVPEPGLGDADFDGDVDDDDLSLLLANWGSETAGWGQGEFNSTLPVDDDDLSLLLANWTGPLPAAVPEPATIGLIALGGLALLRGKR